MPQSSKTVTHSPRDSVISPNLGMSKILRFTVWVLTFARFNDNQFVDSGLTKNEKKIQIWYFLKQNLFYPLLDLRLEITT